ncbi:MAG: binding-protein-dependent transport system inner rane component [Chloroflexi bacterium]|jgi:multiple sugar transport system permease protein|nr:binding-protein-dependent transport system inner rane component [Chloroflexota bacterium]
MARQLGAKVDGATVVAPRRRLRRIIATLVPHLLLALVAFLFLWPFYWMTTTGFKSIEEILSPNIIWFPGVWRWSNFGDVLNYPGFPFLRYMVNSFVYAGSVTIGTVLSCSFVGYGFARLRFPGRNILFAFTIATMMIPTVVTFIPTYVLFRYFHLLGTYAPLILPSFFGNAFFIFMLRQFFMGLPWELSEAAKVDGAGEFRIFWKIMLPLVRPALIVVAVFSFVWTWQEFFQPLIYLSDPDTYPLSLGLFAFQGERTTDWQLLMAAGTLTTLPLVVLFFAAQRYFLQGITMTGLKG